MAALLNTKDGPCVNVIIKNGNERESDSRLFPPDENIYTLPAETDMLEVLVLAGVWSSKSQARKNWGGDKFIHAGWTDITLGKKNRVRICIWNPAPWPGNGLAGCLNRSENDV